MKRIKEYAMRDKIREIMAAGVFRPAPDEDERVVIHDRIEQMARRVSNRIYHMIIEESNALYK